MKVWRFRDRARMGPAAAERAAEILRAAQTERRIPRFIAATGASQFDFLAALVRQPGIDWARVEMFHLDEYLGLPMDHPASFRRYLLERLIRPAGIVRAHLLDGDVADPLTVCRRIGQRLQEESVDVAFVGIGENGHLAFNDPPADFDTEEPYKIVDLDERCRQQQVNEGWFPNLDAVPRRAISMTIRQILKARRILCIVPETRKAEAVRACLEGPISPMAPASALRMHPHVEIYLDTESSSLLQSTPMVHVP